MCCISIIFCIYCILIRFCFLNGIKCKDQAFVFHAFKCVLAFLRVVIKCYMGVCVCVCPCMKMWVCICLYRPISSQKTSRDQEISLFRHISGFFFPLSLSFFSFSMPWVKISFHSLCDLTDWSRLKVKKIAVFVSSWRGWVKDTLHTAAAWVKHC